MSSVSGSVGGAADDAGTEYKRAVVAYAVAHGLTDIPLPLPGMPDDSRVVVSVATETTDAVDDVRIDFESGRSAYLQAKRTLRAGTPFEKAVAQWVKAAEDGLDPATQRLIIVSGRVSGPLAKLGRLLERMRTDHPAALTSGEQQLAAMLDGHLTALTAEQREAVWASAAIWELRVEEPAESDAHNAVIALTQLVAGDSFPLALQAWTTLLSHAGLTARQRTGHNLPGWVSALTSASIPLAPPPQSATAAVLRRQDAIAHYFAHLLREGTNIDLRALGANLPPLPLEETDSDVHVGVDPEDPRIHGELLWAFLRRHRVTLTGLPGGGKSTAIRYLAAQLTRDETFPFPVVASLRGLDPEHPTLGFRDQIVEAATKNIAEPHRQEVRSEIARRLREGAPIALLLDSLDETYNQRHAVVSALQSMVDSFGDGPSVLVATRHVAYAQAATLGWHDLELLPPVNILRTVRGVLELAARQDTTPRDDVDGWVDERVTWVQKALADSPVLEETPLLPVFLALLSTSRSVHELPRARGPILVAVVKNFVLRRELVQRPVGDADADAVLGMGVRAFISEAAAILDSQGSATVDEVTSSVAADLQREWGLAQGPARAAAMRAVRSLDEAGVFVFDITADRVVPRIALLSEVGAAMYAIENPSALPQWIEQRVKAEQYESISLACTLSDAAMAACDEHLEFHPESASLAVAMAHASHAGKDLTEKQLRNVCKALISDICSGTASGWRRFSLLLRLPVPTDLIERLLISLTHLPEEYRSILRTEVQHVLGYQGPFVHGHDDFRKTFDLGGLPTLPGSDPKPDLRAMLHSDLRAPQVHAAEHLLIADPTVASELVAVAVSGYSSRATQNSFRQILLRHGHHDDVATIDAHVGEQIRRWDLTAMLPDFDDESHLAFYGVFDEWERAPLSAPQSVTASELASLLQFARLDAYSTGGLLPKERTYVLDVLRYTAQALALDLGVLSAQASITLARMRAFNSPEASRALSQPVDPHPAPDWAKIENPAHAATVFARTLARGLDHATFAAYMLSEGPEQVVAPELRRAIERLSGSPRHQRLAALALAKITATDALLGWFTDASPVIREVVASLAFLPEHLRREMLVDPDRKVRIAALRPFIDEDGPDLDELLDSVLAAAPVGWMCRRCATVNGPDVETCSDENCPTTAPQLRELALRTRQRTSG